MLTLLPRDSNILSFNSYFNDKNHYGKSYFRTQKKSYRENIEKAFRLDVEKAFPIGTIRVWDGVQYRKVNDGEWVKVKGEKESSVATSGMIKKFKSDLEDVDWNLHKIRSGIEARIKERFEKENPEHKGGGEWKIAYRVTFEKFKDDNLKNDPYYIELQKQLSQYKELSDEIRELNVKYIKEQKLRREEKHGGRKELNDKDVDKLLGTITYSYGVKRIIDDNDSEIPALISCKEFYDGIVSSENYYMCTDANFEAMEIEKWEKVDGVLKQTFDPYDTFNKMKNSGKFKYTYSPKSNSEYLVDEKEGVVYRIADHWGRCASCNWDIKDNEGNFIGTGRYIVLAKCRFKDMEMNNDYRYRFENPKYVEKFIEIGRKEIEKVFNLISRDDIYFTDKAKKILKGAIDVMKYNYKLKYNRALEKMVDNLIEKFNNIP